MQVGSRATLALILTAALAACSDRGDLVSPDVSSTLRSGSVAQGPALPQNAHTRWDAPWWRLSDAELVQEIEKADGTVLIGFKEPGARGGVDDFGRVLVSAPTVASGKSQVRALGAQIQMEFEDMPMVVARIPAARVAALRAHPLVDYLEPVTQGEWLQQQIPWNVQRVEAPQAWPLTNGRGQGQRVLILDSGAPVSHADVAADVVQACDGSDGFDQMGHGTQVAGVVAARDNTIGIIGVAPSVALWSSKIGTWAPTTAAAACGVQFGRSNNTFAINISASLTSSAAMTDQIKAAYWQNGLIIVAAAGNSGSAVSYPANMAEVIAVAATDVNNVRPSWSNTGSALELSAPGVGVLTTCPGSTYCSVDGTSFAAPHVAAAAAMLKAHNPAWTNVQIRERLRTTAQWLGSSTLYGHGLLRIHSAMTWTAPPPAPTVDIGGPTVVNASSYCSWWASVSGGTPPFTYEWTRDWAVVSTSEWYNATTPGGNFTLTLSVTDANNQTGVKQIWVSEASPWDPQPECLQMM
jgi:subtilisin